MSLAVRMPALSRDVEVMLKDTLGPEARSRYLADFARDQLEDAQAMNRQAFERVPPHESFVDGRESADFDAVRPDGTITINFQLLQEVLEWIGEQLVLSSPVLTGNYAKSHTLFADGVEVTDPRNAPADAKTFTFISDVLYARKIGRGLSPQAPDGVYEVVSALAHRRFSNIAKIFYAYSGVAGSSERYPAIEVSL